MVNVARKVVADGVEAPAGGGAKATIRGWTKQVFVASGCLHHCCLGLQGQSMPGHHSVGETGN